jgi:phosphatidylglycerol:prolipoprotein diacylglycerol transferase
VITWTFSFDPIIAQLGPFQLGWHGIFTAVAVAVAIWFAGYLGLKRGIPQDTVYGIAGWGVVGGIIGARVFHVADHLEFYLANPLLIPMVWEGGIAVYGAFIGGIVGGGIAAWRSHLDPWPLLDIAAPAMLLGQAIGRLGCLSNGDAWGSDATGCQFCIAIRYTNPNALLPADLKGVPTYAYPLYEIVAVVALLGILWLLRDWLRERPGMTFLIASVGYAIIRFGLTFYRQETVIIWGLQEAQVIALVTAAVAIGVGIWRFARRPSAAPTSTVSA